MGVCGGVYFNCASNTSTTSYSGFVSVLSSSARSIAAVSSKYASARIGMPLCTCTTMKNSECSLFVFIISPWIVTTLKKSLIPTVNVCVFEKCANFGETTFSKGRAIYLSGKKGSSFFIRYYRKSFNRN